MDNNGNNNQNKNNNKLNDIKSNKTINLEDKKASKDGIRITEKKKLGSKYQKQNKTLNNNGKVISYSITKKKKIVKKTVFKNRTPMIIILVLCIICFISYVIKNNLPGNTDTSTSKFASIDPTVDQNDFVHYSNIISQAVLNTLNITSDESVITEKMHKNGPEILAQGYFFWEKGEKVYFDITLNKDKPISLLINGIEYIN